MGGWGVFVGVFLQATCAAVGRVLYKNWGSKATQFPKMKLGLMITKYEIRA